jgi:hypothetical protein
MTKSLLFGVVLLGAGTVLPGAAAKDKDAVPRFSNPTAITNPFLPLSKLNQDILEGTEEGKTMRVERTMKPGVKQFTIGGQKVDAAIMEDREIQDGELEEVTLDYFAQSDDGTVYYLGEDVDNYKNGKIVAHEGAWLYGVNSKHLGIIITGKPAVGQKFSAENAPGITTESDTIESLGETVTVPAGTYTGCVKIKEVLDDGSVEYKYYAPGVGVVREAGKNVELTLRSHTEK